MYSKNPLKSLYQNQNSQSSSFKSLIKRSKKKDYVKYHSQFHTVLTIELVDLQIIHFDKNVYYKDKNACLVKS